MKQSKEYRISKGLFLASIVSFCASGATGLFLSVDSSIDKIFMFLGFALLGFGFVYLNKAKGQDSDKEN